MTGINADIPGDYQHIEPPVRRSRQYQSPADAGSVQFPNIPISEATETFVKIAPSPRPWKAYIPALLASGRGLTFLASSSAQDQNPDTTVEQAIKHEDHITPIRSCRITYCRCFGGNYQFAKHGLQWPRNSRSHLRSGRAGPSEALARGQRHKL